MARALLFATTALTALAAAQPSRGQDATWRQSPGSSQLTDAPNWSSGAVPTGTASFGPSDTTALTLSNNMTIGGWTLDAGAPAYVVTLGANLNFTGAGIVVDGGDLAIINTNRIVFQGSSSAGGAGIANNSVSGMAFFDSSSAGGAVIANNGGMTFFDISSAGSATITSTSNGNLNFFDGSTAGNATIVNTNNSVISFVFHGSSSAGGATITNAGYLAFRDSSTAGSAAITNTSSLNFFGTSTAGGATITNTGGLSFFNTSSAGSAAITNSSQFFFLGASTAGSAAITNTSQFFFFGASTAGSAAIANNGELAFAATSTAGSATITNTGSLNFFDTGTAGSATIVNTNKSVTGFVFHHSSSAGSATITNAGYLAFRDSSTAGSAAIANTSALAFAATSTAGNAVITGAGSLSFVDGSSTGHADITSGGTVTLATTNTTGAATVTIQSGGSLGGTGAVGNTTIQSGGTLAPGQLIVNGSLTLNGGATYAYAVGSLTSASGSASLAGTLQLTGSSAGFQNRTYTVLTAVGGVSGTFTLVSLPGVSGHIHHGANDVTLVIDAYKAANWLAGQGGRNPANVAAGLDAGIAAAGGTPPAVFNALLGQSGAGLVAMLNGLSGEAATGTQASAMSVSSLFLNLMLDPMAGARGATASAPASSLIEMADLSVGRAPAAQGGAGWSVWTKAFGQAGRTASDAGLGAAGTASSVFGIAAGADKRISADTLVGFALAGGGASFGLGSRGQGSGDYFQAGLYTSTRLGEGYLSAALAYGWNRYEVSRSVSLGGVSETYSSAPVAHTFGGRIEAGRRFGTRAFAWTPYAALEAIGYSASGYREGFAAPATGVFALTYGARTTGTVRTELGLRADSLTPLAPGADLLTFGRLAYGYQANTQRSVDAAFQTLANSGFAVFGARASTHTALATLGIEARFAGGMRVSASLDGELGDRHRSVRANLGLRHSW
ncbi:autotransporter outer membrane beta-barrel domain-containing protein [Phreatobacter stygius]|uniref:Autotransporter domain-containing protein n=1 Tax=Phreatobacter stygius TaxID=1940610 RepID=A0A4D7AVW4_9HYPH|nr:autotransporter outer membrane beta-barrel domain-containing protein [Phreatobacter stygius]QCI63068.1 autotransporter domain-containing protein [Phreatobacter stygius]